MKVVKKNGEKQVFVAAKVRRSVEKAAKEAKYSLSARKELVKEVAEPVIKLYKKKKVVKAADLRKAILGRLDRKAKRVSVAWRRYDRRAGKK